MDTNAYIHEQLLPCLAIGSAICLSCWC